MSIIAFTCATLGGALNPVKVAGSAGEISVGRNQKAPVVMTGYIGAGRVKDADGEYKPSAFGRLSAKAALVGEGDKQRLAGEAEGGVRFVLFKNGKKKSENDPDYTGNLEVGDVVYPLFGRKIKTEAGSFIGLSSGEAEPRKERGKTDSAPAHADSSYGTPDADDVPFAPIARRSHI